MHVGLRRMFRAGDDGWDDYIRFIHLPQLREVRSLDAWLNRIIDGDYGIEALDDLRGLEPLLRQPTDEPAYIQLQVNLTEGEIIPSPFPEGVLLGYDLMSTTQTSALLNCGAWTGVLEPFTQRLNHYGLLDLADAEAARELLPIEWGDNLDADADVVALFELRLP